MKFCFKPRRNVILDLVLILTVFFIGFAAYRTAPKARAGGNAWENSAFGPLDGLEESVYNTAANLANNSFMSVARLQQPILSYAVDDGGIYALRMLPTSCDALSGSSALAAAAAPAVARIMAHELGWSPAREAAELAAFVALAARYRPRSDTAASSPPSG